MASISDPCLQCGAPCPPLEGRGRPRKWCSDQCRMAYRKKSLPSKTMACSSCCRPMWRSGTSLPEGQATCLPCRRVQNRKAPRVEAYGLRTCKVCGGVFEALAASQRYCNAECRSKRNNWGSTPTDPKYRTKEHRDRRAALVRQIKAGHLVECTADECVIGDRAITNTDGRDCDGLHLGHNADGITYAGPQHRACNIRDGARRANVRSRASR